MEVAVMLEQYGLAGLIIVGLVWYARAERAERIEAQKENTKTLNSIFPVIVTLNKAIETMENNAK